MKKLTKEKKKEFVEILTDEIKANNINLLVSFSGLSVGEMQQLRGSLKEAGCNMRVVKNTLLGKAYKNIKCDEMTEKIGGPVFIIWAKSDDEIKVIKNLYEFKKKTGKIDVRAGFISDRVLSSEELELIGKLPGRKGLEAKIVWCLRMPAMRIVNSLKFPLMKLINDINQIAETKK
ncbi:MAG: 50S ribosomal protein L10 [Candidatus Omnitrophica bacterium]|nr:50S ribosomal protein L10 [Candidatus Omnitrophota bacterium]